MQKRSYKELEKQRREQDILHETRTMLVSKGYSSLNMDELADNIGISKPTLYQHFKSKEELIARVIIEDHTTLSHSLTANFEGSPLEHLKHTMRMMLRHRYGMNSAFASLGPEIIPIIASNERLIAMRENLWKFFTEIVEKAKQTSEIEADLPTPLIIRSMFCLQGALAEKFGMRSPPYASEEELNQAIEYVIRLFSKGIENASSTTPKQ